MMAVAKGNNKVRLRAMTVSSESYGHIFKVDGAFMGADIPLKGPLHSRLKGLVVEIASITTIQTDWTGITMKYFSP